LRERYHQTKTIKERGLRKKRKTIPLQKLKHERIAKNLKEIKKEGSLSVILGGWSGKSVTGLFR